MAFHCLRPAAAGVRTRGAGRGAARNHGSSPARTRPPPLLPDGHAARASRRRTLRCTPPRDAGARRRWHTENPDAAAPAAGPAASARGWRR
ncbi:hypothetical protein G6F31_021023 [Rhizopus arrhizus]|nr:hypothetical protein G6F31_021023 [Rhizopus arrhizus]